MLLKLGLVLLIQFGFIAGVYVPNESANKPVYTAGLKTTNSKTSYPVIHQNYSHINYQKHTSAQTIDKIYEQVFDQQIDNTHNFDQQIDNGRNVGQQIDNTQSFDQQVDNGHNFDQQDFGYRRPQKYQRTPNSDHYHHSSNLRPTNYFSGQSVHHKSQTQINSQPMSQCPPGETGQFVYEASCNQFLNCWKGRGVPQNCAPGTLFNPLTLECDCADKVQCVSSPRNLPSEPITHKQQAHCPSGFSGIIPYYENCSKFINCDNGREHIMDCPPGTLFSVKNNLCDFPYKVDCVNGDQGKGEECGPGGCQTGHHHGHGYYYGLKPSGQNFGKFDDGQYRGEEQGYNSGQYSGGYRGGRYDDGQYRGENQYQGQNSGQYSGGNQGGRYDDGQYREEHHNKGKKFDDGQYRGENQGQNSGQYQGQNSGQNQGHNSGQNQGQNSGQYQGQYSGQNKGQNSGQYQGQNSGHYQGQVSPNSRPSQTGQTIKQYGTNAQNSWSGQSQSSGGQTSASQIQTTHQASTVQQKGASFLPKSQDLRPKCPPGHTGLMKHPTICAKFLNCNHGQTFIQDCGPGTVFNPAISACDFPHNVNCKNVEETNSGSYSGSNSGSNSGKDTQTGTYTSTNSGSYSGSNSGQGSQSYSGAISGSHSGANSGQGSYSGSNSGAYSGSNSGQGSYSGANSGSHSGTNLGQGTHSGSNSGSYSGSYSGSNSGFPSNTNSGFPSTTNSGSYSGSNSGTGSGSNFGQGSNLNGQGQYAGHGWHSGTHSSQNYRPGNGHSAVYHGQGSSGFVGASGQGQNATKPGFSTNGKYSSGYQGSNVQSPVKGTLLSAKNEHVYGQRPYIEEEVGNEQGLDGSSSNQPQVGNQEGFGHHHHDHNHSSFDGPGHGHHHHHQHSDFRGPEFANNQHQHQHHHNHPNFEGPGSGHQHQHQHNHHSNHGTNFEDFGHHHNFSQGRNPHSNFNVQTVDNQNFYQVTENPDSSTRSSFKSKHAPPPFPSTDVNADYVFEYEDLDEGNVGASKAVDNWCDSKGFECGNKVCVSPSKVCDGKKECPNGKDEEDCFQYYSGFVKIGGTKLAVKEMQKTANITCLWCSKLCALNTKCKAFNYRAMDGTCYLLNSNIGLSGALILLENYDYYESKNQSIDCSQGYECRNKKCISKKQVCNGLNDCGDGLDEKGCKAEAFAYSLHLVGGNNKHSGNLEVHAFNKKGFICDDMFGLRNADVACRELGFPLGALEVKGNSFFAPNATTSFYMMDDITCLGNETSLRDCDFNGWGAHNCGPLEIVGVVCKTPQETCPADHWQCDTGKECLLRTFLCDGIYDCTDGSDEDSKYCEAPISIRLVNGTSADNGRVEIRYKGVWGSICDDDFNDDAAKVVCRQLGFKGSGYAKKDGFYGPGSGPIWLDQVFCSGNEDSVANCTHWEWGENNCEHTEDVGVICSNFDTSGKPRHLQDVPDVKLAKGPILPKKCGMRSDDMFSEPSDVHFRVVRGSLAQQGHYPWQASIRVKGKTRATHWCGAIVISPSFVLTAAHCLIGFSKGAYYVVAGDYNVDTVEGTEQEAFIEDFILHENFRVGTKMNNDIAVVKLKGKGFELTKAVQAICLPEADTSYERRNCTISGFGSIESGKSKSSKDLRAGWLPILPIEVCKMPHIYGESITQGMFCAGSLDEGVDACDGDSGGPFACLKDGAFTLYGITSWGQHCGYANKPGVYVKVAHYRSWIDKTLQKLINT